MESVGRAKEITTASLAVPRPPSVSADLRLLDPLWHEPVSREILPNGLTLILKPDRAAARNSASGCSAKD